jgi:hypothetical protein
MTLYPAYSQALLGCLVCTLVAIFFVLLEADATVRYGRVLPDVPGSRSDLHPARRWRRSAINSHAYSWLCLAAAVLCLAPIWLNWYLSL